MEQLGGDDRESFSAEETAKKINDLLNSENYTNIGNLIDLGKFKQAEEKISSILKENPENQMALLLLGMLRTREGRVGSAKEIFEKLIDIDPEVPITHYLFGVLLSDGLDRKRGIEELRKAVELDPENAEVKSVLATRLFKIGIKEEAKKFIDEAIRQDPANDIVKHNYYIVRPEKSGSAKLKTELLSQCPDSPESINNLGAEYMNEGKYREAVDAFRRALEQDPSNELFKSNLLIARRDSMLFYRPMAHFNRFANKHGAAKFYMMWIPLWFTIVFILSRIYPPLILVCILFIVYTWVATPIADFLIKIKK